MKAMSYYNKAKAPLQVAGELLSQTIALFRSAMLLIPYSSSRIASSSFRFAIGAPSVQCNIRAYIVEMLCVHMGGH